MIQTVHQAGGRHDRPHFYAAVSGLADDGATVDSLRRRDLDQLSNLRLRCGPLIRTVWYNAYAFG